MPAEMIREFFSHPFNRLLAALLLVLGTMALVIPSVDGNGGGGDIALTIHFFHMPGCPHCSAEEEFQKGLLPEYPNIRIVSHNVAEQYEFELFSRYYDAYEIEGERRSVPLTLIGDRYILGFDTAETTGETMREYIDACLEDGCPTPEDVLEGRSRPYAGEAAESPGGMAISLPLVGTIDLSGYSLPALAVVLGLVDGFNPCAMWVLVYMIALVLELKDPKRMWLIVGVFLASSGILYFLFMTAWLNVFLFLGYVRAITIIVGCAALGFGILNLKEYYDTKGAVVCKVGDEKDKVKTANKMKSIINAEMTIFTLGSIIALAFAVNSIEFVCSSALPAIFAQVLAISELPVLEHYAYILIYVFFYMLDDLVIFSLAAMAASHLAAGNRYVAVSKILGGAILVFLGLMLLFAPDLLR